MDKMNLTYEETKIYQTDYDLVPLCREIYADVITPINLLKKLTMLDQNFFLLSGAEGFQRFFKLRAFQVQLAQQSQQKGEIQPPGQRQVRQAPF